jgi:HEPN domain-containing protein
MTEFEKTINYLQNSAEKDWAIAQKLFRTKDYAYSLFFCHLALEKMLKCIIVFKTDKAAPFSHDLAKLASLAGVPVDKETALSLDEITNFNIAARYDDEKLAFYKKANRQYATEYFKISERIFLWLKNNYLKM